MQPGSGTETCHAVKAPVSLSLWPLRRPGVQLWREKSIRDVPVIHGSNEAGRSTTFLAWLDLLYGFPERTRPTRSGSRARTFLWVPRERLMEGRFTCGARRNRSAP
ncbi:AAA family ATPase [Paracoccus sp. (in: a-proteobacteria)]|uniref:AAA family ATPase n=1 Tax=Paracoccus sp. TaxID=267 RepID=UPI00396CCD63